MFLTLLMSATFSFQQNVDAMLTWRNNKMYAFSGNVYYRYDLGTNRVDPGYPKYIQGNWQGLPNRIDAAINWQNGKAYFFSGAYYYRYDINTDRLDPGYPKPIAGSWGVNWNQIDAATYFSGTKAYLFNSATQSYVRYDIKTNRVDPGYPKPVVGNWNGYPFPRVDAATMYYARLYVVGGGYYGRFANLKATLEAGYPKTLNFLPDVNRTGTAPPATTYRPPATTPPPANTYTPPPATNAKCTVNGTLAFRGNGVWQQWNGVNVELHAANSYFNGRYNQLTAAGYTSQQAMSQTIKEGNLWVKSVTSTTKAPQYNSNKYGMAYSWFGFVGLNPGVYRVFVPGYPQLSRWLKFTAGGQKLKVELEYP